ncbi:unnamed protein product, partial [Larinioides sclopetarius]
DETFEDSSDDSFPCLRPEYRPARRIIISENEACFATDDDNLDVFALVEVVLEFVRDEHHSEENSSSSDYPSLRPEYRPRPV